MPKSLNSYKGHIVHRVMRTHIAPRMKPMKGVAKASPLTWLEFMPSHKVQQWGKRWVLLSVLGLLFI